MFEDVINTLNKPGSIAIVPTDTVYGIVAKASDEQAVARLYDLKQRENKPGTLIADSIDQLISLGIKRRYLTAVENFWPGAISVIIPCSEPQLSYLHMGKMTLAVRVPAGEQIRKLLKKTGPLLTTSANPPGKKPAETLEQAQAYFGKRVDAYVDGGDLGGREPSTIIRIVDDAIDIIRQGAVRLDESGRKL